MVESVPVSFCLLWGFLPFCETPELLRRFENVTRAYTSTVRSSKWVKQQFWVNCPSFSYNSYYNLISLSIADVKVFFRLRFSHINVGSSSWGMLGKVIGQYCLHSQCWPITFLPSFGHRFYQVCSVVCFYCNRTFRDKNSR